jgi:ATP-dependent RNA helicase DDX56/DBP9
LIATDSCLDKGEQDESDGEDEDGDKEGNKPEQAASRRISKTARKGKSSDGDGDADYGVSRGIDFHGVKFVINFDFPLTPAAYTHRIGRTARGSSSGTALSLITKFTPSVRRPDLHVSESYSKSFIMCISRISRPKRLR